MAKGRIVGMAPCEDRAGRARVLGFEEDYSRRCRPAGTTSVFRVPIIHPVEVSALLRADRPSAERSLALLVALQAQSDRIFHRDDSEEALTRTVFTEPLERLLRDGIADGSLREVDPVEMATVLFNLVGWTYIHLRTGHGWKPERALRATLEPVLHGILATTEPAAK
jgi:hypothetical protein